MPGTFFGVSVKHPTPATTAASAVLKPSTTLRLFFTHTFAEPQDPAQLRHCNSNVQSSPYQLKLDFLSPTTTHTQKTKLSQSYVMLTSCLLNEGNATHADSRLVLVVAVRISVWLLSIGNSTAENLSFTHGFPPRRLVHSHAANPFPNDPLRIPRLTPRSKDARS